MTWWLLALIAAFAEASKDLLTKRWIDKIDETVVAFGLALFSLPIIVLALLFKGLPAVGANYWYYQSAGTVLDVVGILLYLKAVKSSDLSVILPLKMLTPLFMLILSPIMIGEYPTLIGIGGVFLIILGSYLLNISAWKDGPFAPFHALLSDRGARLMLLCAFIFSFCCMCHKSAISLSSPLFYGVTHQAGMALILGFLVLRKSKKIRSECRTYVFPLISVGLVASLIVVSIFSAFDGGIAVYATSLKRTSVLMTIVLAAFFYREKGLRDKLCGATVMVSGAALTVF